jgi:hypothetical protein
MDNIELSYQTPFGTLNAAQQAHEVPVWLIELDAQVFKDYLPEPAKIGGRTYHQLLIGSQAMPVHETLEATALQIILVGSPDNGLVEWNLFWIFH